MKRKVVLIHDTTVKFPQYSQINKLDRKIQEIFDTIAIPLIPSNEIHCWERIIDKIIGKLKVVAYFLLHIDFLACETNELVFKSQTENWTTNCIEPIFRT